MQHRKWPTAFKMAAAAMFEIQVNAIKWAISANYHPIFMKIGTQTEKRHAKFKNRNTGSVG
jgi:hypothetical protein